MVEDARPHLESGKIGLEQTGFTLTNNRTQCSDFRDEDLINSVYLPEMQDLICRLTGAKLTYHYGFLVRTEKPIDFNDGYARFVHCDYNVKRVLSMSHEVLRDNGVDPDESDTFAWFNTWRPFDYPAINNPLAFIDNSSLSSGDVIDYFYTGRGRDSLVGICTGL